jgi:NDP-sugar pyrophosphorylase family protein
MRAVILAGGRGTRLAPYTTVIPKPLLPVGDLPILEIVVRQLARAGIDHLTLSLGYMSEYFRVFLSHRKSLSRLMRIDFVEEEKPTGTAGSLSSVAGLEGTFLVMNGDVLTNLDYRALLSHHADRGAWLTIATHNKPVKIDLGVLEDDRSGNVTNYIEKPVLNYTVSMGIYVYEPEVLQFIRPGEYLDFPDLVLRLLRTGRPVSTFRNDATWLDLGRPEDLQRATDIFLERKDEFLPATVGDREAVPQGACLSGPGAASPARAG